MYSLTQKLSLRTNPVKSVKQIKIGTQMFIPTILCLLVKLLTHKMCYWLFQYNLKCKTNQKWWQRLRFIYVFLYTLLLVLENFFLILLDVQSIGPLADSFIESQCWCVCVRVCPLPMQFFSRPLIGPQITWSDPGLSLVDQT